MRYTILLFTGLGLFAVAIIMAGMGGAAQAGPTPPAITAMAVATPDPATAFDGGRAYAQLLMQMEFGPRYPGSDGHRVVADWILESMAGRGWRVEQQRLTYNGVEGRNIVARANVGQGPIVILGAHYDTRRLADQTPGAAEQGVPVPGAVDGASGVAVLMELARALNLEDVPREIWIVFFDMEDGGRLDGWDWIVGSTHMANELHERPEAVVIVDLVGDADQQIYYEGYSDPHLSAELWSIAAGLGYDSFIAEQRHTVIDDHLPFARLAIPTVLIVDLDYAYWHTVEDTADKASADSLERVGRVLQVWLEQVLAES